MKNEFKPVGLEYKQPSDFSLPKDTLNITAVEHIKPADDISFSNGEFPSLAENQKAEEANKKENLLQKKKKQADKACRYLAKQMSYLVASAVAVVTVAATVDTEITENVFFHGGQTRGDLRFSIQWNDTSYNPNDFDAHCIEPGGYDIYFSNAGIQSPSGGTLDVDIIEPTQSVAAVENIIYLESAKMEDGVYKMVVHCYNHNGGTNGFSAEVVVRGRVYHFNYNHNLSDGEFVNVANVTVDNGKMSIERLLE